MTPETFNWVEARANCSLALIFGSQQESVRAPYFRGFLKMGAIL
jgi:hypothetical protein